MNATTANRYLLDTNILTDLIKNPSGRVKERIAAIGEANICTSIIVACELRFGARKKNAPLLTARIERLLQTIEVLPLDGDVDRAYAEVRAMLESAGRPSGANDLLQGLEANATRRAVRQRRPLIRGPVSSLRVQSPHLLRQSHD